MAPKSPRNKKATIVRHGNVDMAASPSMDYGEAQSDEIEALRAIYMDDFEDVELKNAWSKTTDRSFKLRLRAFSDEESFIVLSVRLTATYPRTLPVLDIQGLQAYHERTQKRMNNIIHGRAKQLVGDVMIHAIASDIQDALEDAVQARQQGTLPSLEEERATAEEVASAVARQAEEDEARRRQEVLDEEERVLKQMVDEEVGRRGKRRISRSLDTPVAESDADQAGIIRFDQPALLNFNNESLLFDSALVVSALEQSPGNETLLAKPQLVGKINAPLLTIKRIVFEKEREDVVQLETVLETMFAIRHTNLLNLLTFRMEKLDVSRTRLVLCHDNAGLATLQDVLELGELHISKARRFMVEMLEALECLHQNGIGHGNVSPSCIMISGSPAVPKLAGAGYVLVVEDDHRLPAKWQPPEGRRSSIAAQRKSDIWQFGTLVAQMILGLKTTTNFSSPQLMLAKLDLSNALDELMRKTFTTEPRKRPSAFELLAHEFLRTDEPALQSVRVASAHGRPNSSTGLSSPLKRRSRHNSAAVLDPMSRYASDFTEIGRLGRGGFGEVVKARNKLDGGIYAVKKIKQAPQLLDQVISEVMLLNRLNHPYVVRYFSTWVEDEISDSVFDESSTATATATETGAGADALSARGTNEDEHSSSGPRMDFGYQSTGGLDFVSSSGFPPVDFGDDSDEERSIVSEPDEADGSLFERDDNALGSAPISSDGEQGPHKPRSDSQRAPSMLYIQMEYCERHTLRDLVRKDMSVDDAWRYVRQITEGLAHVHGHGIIHRDLKPDNIFIDMAGNPKIGDFGLATTSQHHFTERVLMSGRTGGDMTRSVGTTLYVAPELRSSSSTTYSDKVDMYSLGIIFYEMCQLFTTAMERVAALQDIRQKEHKLPLEFHPSKEKAAQGRLISCLISHKPSERPSSTELLRSDIMPVKIEDETIRQALSGLSDPRSPYHQKMMSALFAHDSARVNRVKALAWDARASAPSDDVSRLRLRGLAKQTLEAIFRRHGAEESRRQTIFPRSSHNTNANVVQLLDASGNLLQLPYDLTVPHARQLASQQAEVRCTFAFGNAYRDSFTGGPPRANEEVDFDIVIDSGGDSNFDDAEILKVMDEVVAEMPCFAAASSLSFHLGHTSILGAVLDHCRVPAAQQSAVKEILSRLGYNHTSWGKVRVELRKFGLPDTTLDDMQQFDFRDVPEKAATRLLTLLEGASSRTRSKVDEALQTVHDITNLARQMGVQSRIFVVPLASVKATFYEGGMLFQCVLERKSNRLVVAAGGRYDSLIRAQWTADGRTSSQGAVGVAIGLDFLVSNMARNSESSSKKAFLKDNWTHEPATRRCDVAVVASGTEAMRSAGVRILASLWASNISAELVVGTRALRERDYNLVVAVRHEASNSVRVTGMASDSEGTDVLLSALVGHVQQELRERETSKPRMPALLRQPSQPDADRRSNVHVLMARHGSKKSNKYQIVNDAQQQWAQMLDATKDAPILAVETRDDVLELVQHTKLSDAESWRKAVQSVPLNDRQYVQQIHEILLSWRRQWADGDGMREACVFNFRTQHCIYYNLGL